jgi:hypothetical protein
MNVKLIFANSAKVGVEMAALSFSPASWENLGSWLKKLLAYRRCLTTYVGSSAA